jgi:hypothetical protein
MKVYDDHDVRHQRPKRSRSLWFDGWCCRKWICASRAYFFCVALANGGRSSSASLQLSDPPSSSWPSSLPPFLSFSSPFSPFLLSQRVFLFFSLGFPRLHRRAAFRSSFSGSGALLFSLGFLDVKDRLFLQQISISQQPWLTQTLSRKSQATRSLAPP